MKLVHLIHCHGVQHLHYFLLRLKITSNVHHEPAVRKTRRVFDRNRCNLATFVHECQQSLNTVKHPTSALASYGDQFLGIIYFKTV